MERTQKRRKCERNEDLENVSVLVSLVTEAHISSCYWMRKTGRNPSCRVQVSSCSQHEAKLDLSVWM